MRFALCRLVALSGNSGSGTLVSVQQIVPWAGSILAFRSTFWLSHGSFRFANFTALFTVLALVFLSVMVWGRTKELPSVRDLVWLS